MKRLRFLAAVARAELARVMCAARLPGEFDAPLSRIAREAVGEVWRAVRGASNGPA